MQRGRLLVTLGARVVGGTIFGIGWSLLGYCPGTTGGALGEARLDAAWGLLGRVAGSALNAAIYSQLKTTVIRMGHLGQVPLPQVTGLSPWIVIILFSAVCLATLRLFETGGV